MRAGSTSPAPWQLHPWLLHPWLLCRDRVSAEREAAAAAGSHFDDVLGPLKRDKVGAAWSLRDRGTAALLHWTRHCTGVRSGCPRTLVRGQQVAVPGPASACRSAWRGGLAPALKEEPILPLSFVFFWVGELDSSLELMYR